MPRLGVEIAVMVVALSQLVSGFSTANSMLMLKDSNACRFPPKICSLPTCVAGFRRINRGLRLQVLIAFKYHRFARCGLRLDSSFAYISISSETFQNRFRDGNEGFSIFWDLECCIMNCHHPRWSAMGM